MPPHPPPLLRHRHLKKMAVLQLFCMPMVRTVLPWIVDSAHVGCPFVTVVDWLQWHMCVVAGKWEGIGMKSWASSRRNKIPLQMSSQQLNSYQKLDGVEETRLY